MNETWTVSSILDWTAGYFTRNNINEARLDAEVLLASVLNCSRLNLYLEKDKILSEQNLKIFKKLIQERKQRIPVSYILGEKEFMGLRFKVNRHTLIPRPETELLVEEVIKIINKGHNNVIVDLGTGSGNIPISIAKLSNVSKIYSIDVSMEALNIAQDNIDYHGLAAKIELRNGDLFNGIMSESLENKVDIIVSNPPYIAEHEMELLTPELGYEPQSALYGGKDGLDFYRRIIADSIKYLKEGGYLVMEMNSYLSKDIQNITEKNSFTVENIIKDYSGLDRVIIAKILKTCKGRING